MFIIIRNELVYYLSPVLSPQQSIPLIIQPSLESPDQFIYQNRIIGDHLKQQLRNPPSKKMKNRTNTLVLPNSTLFTFCSLSSEKKSKKQQTHDISFSSMSAVPAATARSPNLFHTFFYNLKNSFNLMVKQTINTLAVASNPLILRENTLQFIWFSLFVRQHYMINYYYYYII